MVKKSDVKKKVNENENARTPSGPSAFASDTLRRKKLLRSPGERESSSDAEGPLAVEPKNRTDRKKKKSKPILLLGSYGRGNIGDDAFLLAALRLFPDHELIINSANDDLLPAEVKGRVTTIPTTGTKDLTQKLRILARVGHVVYCGGDLWVQLYGDRFPNQSLYKMVALNILARVLGKRVYYVGTGIGRLRGYPLQLARLSAWLANGIAVREPHSADMLDLDHVQTLADLTVNVAEPVERPARKKDEPFVIGISLLYYLPNPEQSFPYLLEDLSNFINGLPKEKFKFIIFPMLVSKETKNDDLWAAEQLKTLVPNANVTIYTEREISKYLQALASVDLLIGARLHAAILATLAGTPSLGLAYRPKVHRFFAMNDLADYCLDLDEADTLPDVFWSIYNDYETAKERFEQAAQKNQEKRIAYQRFIKKHF